MVGETADGLMYEPQADVRNEVSLRADIPLGSGQVEKAALQGRAADGLMCEPQANFRNEVSLATDKAVGSRAVEGGSIEHA